VKFSIRQILASAAGAVIAAVIASTFGVKGTIVGVAIGSAAATMATALVAQSIERGHEAVKQVVVRAPEASTLLRKLGGTGASGGTAASDEAAPTQVVGRSAPEDGGSAETVQMESVGAPVGDTERLEISATADAPATERLRATTAPMRPAGTRPGLRRFSWRTIAATVAIVFVLALVFITAIELISGKPLSAIFGGADTGTTLSNLGGSPGAPTTTTPTSTPAATSTTSTSSTTTTTSATSTTTTTTSPTGESTTTTTSPTPVTTTTAGVGATTTSSTSTSTSRP
jgi:hypothetical protein